MDRKWGRALPAPNQDGAGAWSHLVTRDYFTGNSTLNVKRTAIQLATWPVLGSWRKAANTSRKRKPLGMARHQLDTGLTHALALKKKERLKG